jgi:hypothetical protein
MTRLHRSEHQVGRIKFCAKCDGQHMFPSYQATRSPDGPSLLEVVAGVLVLLVNFLALFYALPILATAVMR